MVNWFSWAKSNWRALAHKRSMLTPMRRSTWSIWPSNVPARGTFDVDQTAEIPNGTSKLPGSPPLEAGACLVRFLVFAGIACYNWVEAFKR